MEAFFKETIIGIILLGAVGSILSASIIWGLNKLVKSMAPKLHVLIKSTIANLVVFSIAPGIKNQIKLYLDANPNKLDAYYSSQKSKIIVLSTTATWLFIWLMVRIKLDGLDIYSFEAILCITSLFLLFGMVIRSQLSLMVPLFIDIDEKVEEHLKTLDPETFEIFQKYRANKALQRTREFLRFG